MTKRILYLIPRFSTGGAEKLVLQYAEYFKQTGLEVAVASIIGSGEMVKEFENSGIKAHASRNRTLGSWNKLKKFSKKFSPDLVHSNVFSADLAGYLLVRKKAKWISTQHNVGQEHSYFRKQVLRLILKKADRVIAVSKTVQDFCLQDLKLSENKVELIENAIDLEKWLSIDTELFTSDKLKLTIIGRLEKQKNHEFLLRALKGLDVDWELNIYGDGGLEKKLKHLSTALKIDKKINWHGVKANLSEELEKIDVVIQPSLWEGMSLVIMEAMASGRLVIASQMAGLGLIENDKTGFLLENLETKCLLGILNSISIQKEQYRKIAKQGRGYAKNNFGISKHLEDLEKIYHES